MAFELTDSLSLPGGTLKPNEDAFGHNGTAAAVLDGATGLGDVLMPGASDAAWIAQFGTRRLLAHLAAGQSPPKALRSALSDTEDSFKGLRRRPPDAQWELPCASMMAAIETGAERKRQVEFFWYGDCGALLKTAAGVQMVGETLVKRAAEAKRAQAFAKLKNILPAAKFSRCELIGQLRKARDFVNSGNYWLFSPDVMAAPHVMHAAFDGAAGAHLLLASDGFLALASDYGAYDAPGLMAAALGKGLAALGKELRTIEESDPDGDKYPRFKKSDDATAVLLKMT
ncbi:MAG TPA: hypothetical protein VHV26_11190 [Rhizomicrobium sp.]|jgi:hypothetical protein|nr:hypothetical protein [Rhizomicrobium sp.]